MKNKLTKLTNNLGFIISITTLVLLLIDNRSEIKQLVKKMMEKESYVKFKEDVSETFSTYGNKATKIYKKAIEIIEE